MSGRGVYGDDMDDATDFDDPALGELLGDVRAAYRTQLPASPALAELFEAAPKVHRSASMRRVLAQLVAATTVVVAATGGLAVAGALPAPIQHVVSSAADGVDVPQGDDATPANDPVDDTSTTAATDESTATTVNEPTTTGDAPDEADDDSSTDSEGGTSSHPENHGAEVSAVAHDKTLHGCEHGRAVSRVASGKVNTKPCPHTDDEAEADTDATTPPTTVAAAPPAPETTAGAGTSTPARKKSKPAHGNSNVPKPGHGKHGG
jgi:hypothetical protein